MITKLSIILYGTFYIVYFEDICGFIDPFFFHQSFGSKRFMKSNGFYHAPIHTSMLVKIGDASVKINIHSSEFMHFNNAE